MDDTILFECKYFRFNSLFKLLEHIMNVISIENRYSCLIKNIF
jgi:hypothetical protein